MIHDEETNSREEEEEDLHFHFHNEETNNQEEEEEDLHFHLHDEEMNDQEEDREDLHFHFHDEEMNDQEEKEEDLHYHFQDEEINEQEEEDEVHYHFHDEEINEQEEEEDEVHLHILDEPNGQDAQENLKMVQEDWQDYRFFPGVHDNLTAHTGDLDRSGDFILFNVFAVFMPFLILDLCLFLAFLPSALINLIALKKEETINTSRIAEDVNEDSFNNDVDELNKGNLQDIFFPCIVEDANEDSFTTLTDGDDVQLNNCNLLVIPLTSLTDMSDNFEEVENHPQEISIFNYDLDHNMEAAEEEIRVPPVQDLATAFMGLEMGNVDHLTTLTEIFQVRVLKRLSKRKWIKPMNRVTKRRNDKLINKRK
ncbi:hypothetical protein BC833DRAFT_457145 [Globomyces pollinis-pini]|nr:hypothetical protein BC833DRAFT_457145 [Globomyces pollinis-pini]